jgi:undecaprenyl-diphosphatase
VSQPLLEIGVLGVLQGATEFLPVSSSGHLALGEQLFAVQDAGLTLNVMLHAGTLLAIVLVLWRRLADAATEGVLALRRPARLRTTSGGRDALFVILASVPTAAVGLLLRKAVADFTHSPLAVGLGFAVTTAVLVSVRWARGGEDEVPSVWGSILIGLAQGIAVVPGISRSGATICAALWLGVRPGRAFELSMLASVPAVLGAVALEAPEMSGDEGALGLAIAGAAIALVVGMGALLLLRGLVCRGRLAWFALWTAPLALACFVLAGRG